MIDYARTFLSSARWRTVRHVVNNRSIVNQVTRVVDNPPLDCHVELLSVATERTAVAEIEVEAKILQGPWMPVAAWIEPAPAADGTQAVHPKLYQVLRLQSDALGDGPYVTLDGCLQKQSIQFFYDVEEAPTCPASTSGVAVNVQGLRRDEETGLYSYALVTTETVEKDVGAYATHIDQFNTRKTVTRLNQREEAVLDADGKPVGTKTFDALAQEIASENSLASATGGGVVVDVQVNKNDDCTANISVTNTIEQHKPGATVQIEKSVRQTKTTTTNENAPLVETPVTPADGNVHKYETTPGGLTRETIVEVEPIAVDSTRVVRETLFEQSISQVSENQPSSDVQPTAPNAGVLVDARQDLNDDGSWNVTTTTTTEKAQANAVVVKTKTARNLQTQTLDQHQAADFTADPAVGSSHRMERSQGGLYNLTTTTNTPTAIAAGDGNTTCKKTIYEHEHTKLAENQSTATRDVADAGNGKTYERVVQLNDDGTFQIQDKETKEIEVEDALVETSATATSTTDRVVCANESNALENVVGLGENNEILQHRSQKTAGGRYENTITRICPTPKIFYFNCAESYNGQQEQYCIFYNQTAERVKTIASAFTHISMRLNDHALYDGNASLVTPPYKSGSAFEKPIETFEQIIYSKSSRTVSSNNQIYTVITFKQELLGVVYDSNLTQDSANNPYTRVNGLEDWKVDHAGRDGDGYYKYSGTLWSRELWFTSTGAVAFRGAQVGVRDLSVALPSGSEWTEAIA